MSKRPQSVNLIKASAGSGKTFTLATNYISLLETLPPASRFPRILAITFTRAATKEMAERIITYLKDIARGEAKEEIISSLASIDNREKFAEELLEELFRNFSSLNISTIDSLVTKLFMASSYPLGYPPTIEITTDSNTLTEKAIELILEEVSQKNPSQIKNLVKNFIYGLDIKSFDLYPNIISVFSKYITAEVVKNSAEIKTSKLRNELITKTIQAKTQLLEKIEDLKRQFPSLGINKTPYNWINSITEDNLINNISIDSITNKFVTNAIKFFNKKNLGKIGDISFIDETQLLLDQLLDSIREIFITLVTEISTDINDIAREISKRYYRIIKEEETIPLSTALSELGKIIGDQSLIPYIFMHFSQKIAHIMIDEFQDTSINQWNFLYPLIIETISKGGSFTAVGDPKQTIYFWRGSERDIFTRVEYELKNFLPVVETLNKNFRSRENIVKYINETFQHEQLIKILSSTISIKDDDPAVFFKRKVVQQLSSSLKHYMEVKQLSNDKEHSGYVEIVDLSKVNDDSNSIKKDIKKISKELLVKFIKEEVEEKNRIKYSDIAILFRKNEDVNAYTTYLLQNSIPVRSTKGVDIREHLLVREIISLLKFLNNPLDNLSFITFLSGKICSKSCGDNFFKNNIEQLLEEVSIGSAKEKAFYLLFREKNKGVWEKYFSRIFSRVGFLPSSDLIWEIYEIFEILLKFETTRPVLTHLLEISREIEDQNSDINSFLDTFEKATDDDFFIVKSLDSVDAVTVSTYHKSKGLEWPVVILPTLGLKYSINDPGKFIIGEDGNYYKIKKDYIRFFPEKIVNEFVNETITWLLGEINLFYVAATRARDELYIYTYPSIGKNMVNLLYHIAFGHYKPDDNGTMTLGTKGEIRRKPDQKSGEVITPTFLNSVSNWENNLIRKPPTLKKFSGEEILKLEEGTFYHKILENIEYLSNNSEKDKEIITEKVEETITELGEIVKREEAIKILGKFLSKEEVKKYFLLPGKVHREMEVIDRSGEIYRIDRVYIEKNKITIIDFKTTIEEEFLDDYREQLVKYRELLLKIFPDKKFELKLLGILDGRIENVN